MVAGTIVSAPLAWAGNAGAESITLTHPAMGSEFSITAYPPEGRSAADLAPLLEEVFAAIDTLEAQISSWREDSQTTYVNNHAADAAVPVSAEFLDVLLAAKDVYERTDGAFDCTVGPLAQLYGLYEAREDMPDAAAIEAARRRVGMDKVLIDAEAGTVAFAEPGVRLDFGGIGKGAALDRAVAMLKARGVRRALLHAGTSSVYALGAPPDAPGWTVRIRHPYNAESHVATAILRDESLSTSGCYGDLPEAGGTRICNIFDPRTGRPKHGILSASAIAPSATETDALSTAFLVMGVEGTAAFCQAAEGVRAVLVPEAPAAEVRPVWIETRDQP